MLLVDDRWFGKHGIGRFAEEIVSRLGDYQAVSHKIPKLHVLDPIWQSLEIVRKRATVYFNPGFNPPLISSAPFIFTIHDLNHIHDFGNQSKVKQLYYDTVMKPACHKAFKVITVSEFSKQEIVDWSGVDASRVVVVGNGCDAHFCPDGTKFTPGFSYLLYVGNYKPHKNLINFIKAFAKCTESRETKLLISGKPDEKLLHLINSLALKQQVEFCGGIPEEKLPDYYRGATAVVLPSLYEGFGLPIIEGMACGIPVLTSNVASMPEISAGHALLFDPYNIDDMANAIDRIIRDQPLREVLSKQGLLQAKKFSWQTAAEKVLDVINQIKQPGE